MLNVVAVAALLVLLVTTGTARAEVFFTGAIRDQTGAAVVDARVTAFDGADRAVGTDRTIADGTFALDARTAPATIGVECDFCRSVRRAIDPTEPAVVIVERFTAVTAIEPSAADLRALPLRSAADIASLLPFTVTSNAGIVDRGLDRTGAVLVDGLPFYRAADGHEFADLVPAYAVAGVTALPAAAAPAYGGYASGGIYDFQLHAADLAPSRLDDGDASDVVLRAQAADTAAGIAQSSDQGDQRQAAYAAARIPFAGGRLSLETVDLADDVAHASGAGIAYATASRRYITSAAFSATEGSDAGLTEASAQLQDRGPLGLTLAFRAARTTSSLAGAGAAQFDGALWVGAHRQTAINTLAMTIAYDRGSDSSVVGSARAAALIGSLTDDIRLGTRWTAHAGVVSDARIPTFAELPDPSTPAAGDRRLLFEQSLSYTDLARLRVTGTTYTQRATGSAVAFVNGAGIDAAWQIAPDFALRTWLLRMNTSATPNAFAPYDTDATFAISPSRGLVWLSYEKFVRVDALVRAGGLEGDVRIPLSPTYAFAVGSTKYDGKRFTTFGLTLR